MSSIDSKKYRQDTLAVRAGQLRSSEQENSEPIFLTSSYTFNNAAEAAARFSGELPGNVYSRFTNTTVQVFEERLAAMEGGERCIATASGMAAILTTCMTLLKAGDHIVSSQNIFGATMSLFNNIMGKFGVSTSYVSLTDYDDWAAAITPATRILFLETPSNPLTEIADIQRLADLAHENDCLLVVDNCFCTPVLQLPFNYGADLVIHSATKYLDGQGRCVGGAVIGKEELLGKDFFSFMRTAGPSMSPFNAWIFLKGLETLKLRMHAHCENALKLAEWLQEQQQVETVYFPGLTSHPQHELAVKQQSGFGGIVSFIVKGGQDAAWKLIDATNIYSITANLGDTRSTITHPASTTHQRISEEQRQAAGIVPGLVRISAGLEDIQDLVEDLEQALGKLA